MKPPVSLGFFFVGLVLDNADGLAGAGIGRAAADPAFQFGNLRIGERIFIGRRHGVGEVFDAFDHDALAWIIWYHGGAGVTTIEYAAFAAEV